MAKRLVNDLIDLSDLTAFIRVVETGSIAGAAAILGMAKSIVSRRIAKLEATLEARLLARTARGTTMTDIGSAYYERVARALAELEAAREEISGAMTEIAGCFRISAPLAFGQRFLAPALADFARAHPKVQLDV